MRPYKSILMSGLLWHIVGVDLEKDFYRIYCPRLDKERNLPRYMITDKNTRLTLRIEVL